jgi:mRNA-degrading endonuclease RelE of RelBE toxin-antitoxin system
LKRFTFTDSAKADLRRIEKNEAPGILKALARFGREGAGDLKKLVDDPQGRYRFRVGDWRVLFRFELNNTIHVFGVENRKYAYHG